MIVNCKRARLYVALSVGGDLDDDGEWELSSHTESCDACRRYHERMRSEFAAFPLNEAAVGFAMHDSVWPELAGKLPNRPGRKAPEFNGWWAALAVSVACAMLAALLQNESSRAGSPTRHAPVASVESDGDSRPVPPQTPQMIVPDQPQQDDRFPGMRSQQSGPLRPEYVGHDAIANFLLY